MNVDDLTAKYIELRDRKAKIKKKAEDAEAALTTIQDAIGDKIREIMHANGVTSLKTAHGTAYIAYRESAEMRCTCLSSICRIAREAWRRWPRPSAKSAVKDR